MYPRIAVCVDNDPNTSRIVQETLHNLGYHVEMASSRTEALRLAHEFKPTLAYVSNEMTGIDALELYRAMQQVSHRTKGILTAGITNGHMALVTDHVGIDQVIIKTTE